MATTKADTVISPKLLRNQVVTLADLEEFKSDLLVALNRLIQANVIKPPKKWLKSHEVKALLKISSGTLRAMRKNGTLPFTKIGNLIYYDFEDLTAALSSRKHLATTEEAFHKKQH
jgi:hypothetical protein